MIRDAKGSVDDMLQIKTVLVSVFDKSGLDDFIPRLVELCPGVMFLSTGGTYKKMVELLGEKAKDQLVEVADYTGFPEMEGGLVKTLHPKIHAGILGEKNNPEHQKYIADMNGRYIDMVAVNLYPFEKVIKKIEAGEINPETKRPYDFESARGNIDIGGPCMLRAAAKNFLSCLPICEPFDYLNAMVDLRDNKGAISFYLRQLHAAKVFRVTAEYDRQIAEFLNKSLGREATVTIRQNYGLR